MITASRRHIFFPFLCLFAVLSCGGVRAGDGSFDRGVLFEVRTEAGVLSHLFGTIHSDDGRVLDLPPPVRDAYEGARVFLMEMIPDADSVHRAMVAMVYSDGRKLADVLGPDLFRLVVDAMAERGLSEQGIADFKPWTIVTLLSVPPAKSDDFLDMYLYRSALAAGKPVVGLEAMEEQLEVFDGLSERDQLTLLEETLNHRDRFEEVYGHLLDAYLARDLAELLRLGREYLQGGDGALAERFKAAALDVRNVRMTRRMMPLLEAGGHFIAVGALHLPGRDGILARLRAAGLALRVIY